MPTDYAGNYEHDYRKAHLRSHTLSSVNSPQGADACSECTPFANSQSRLRIVLIPSLQLPMSQLPSMLQLSVSAPQLSDASQPSVASQPPSMLQLSPDMFQSPVASLTLLSVSQLPSAPQPSVSAPQPSLSASQSPLPALQLPAAPQPSLSAASPLLPRHQVNSVNINQFQEHEQSDKQDKQDKQDGIDDDEVDNALIHAIRKSKTKAKHDTTVGSKAGNPGKFKGEMTEFLEDYRYHYDAIRVMKQGKVRAFEQLWFNLRAKFWECFSLKDVKIAWSEEAKDWEKEQLI
ncbi:uncharacterized protein PHACADRAFT_33103 [Phanerochaete carnosa HHB-10118-sp]|uniref:Uncharacterized protein n=1 Tax=Phanerochaete carnosa (strain HHB-10118-sp) TaxID=650164 RepID=K5WH15_PHACS|nr:uncharacterized protein PHACADRAFT_33103 [Phanerochaete carnosa HHB-10118-sp]EKM49502.1 hypothetical protein PHACADRAFT_33103 [Phanerochaete carnosa HHB-10118-sp]